ncbi:hypothetical protein COT99_03765 [Candidatus Falkowbacteria bacterium CG10_big_fil_rev_8_21_14_0_10_43_10]|uniref:ATP-grasp domain-containing protein n=1 Tax=Candidatus Falkowbacteria bacterium CG10_big_fil_rev_8_21_14_0_10_43_10 TaxID=1974567 RepID=A0A2H0V1F7_9BACT|nr:MAG: hypothetical protein COT99_03765 [Candidatus Falkowbacteria bacterium CG10_big_fil_rev_8_21_14_0_10_43_10]
MNKKQKMALWLNMIEPIFLDKQNLAGCYIFVVKKSVLADFAAKNYPAEKLIFLNGLETAAGPSFHDIVFKTDLVSQLKQEGIKCLVIPHRSSEEIERWAKSNKIRLVVTPWKKQQQLEDKKYFDRLLKKFKIESPRTVSAKDRLDNCKTYVVQEKNSFGMFGTKFYQPDKSPKLDIDYKNTLVREFLPGPSAGISIFIDADGNYFLSGLRRQCFTYKNGFPETFLGIQWLPDNFFPESTNKKIGLEIKKLIDSLLYSKFSGVANIDFLIHEGNPYVLECNPRLSSATPQIFSLAELTSGKNAWQFFLNTFQKIPNRGIKDNKLPRHNFSGSLLDIDVPAKTPIRKILPVGVYEAGGRKIKFVSEDMRFFTSGKNRFFLFHELSDTRVIDRDFTLATLISNLPLFNMKSGSLNHLGKKLYDYFKKEFLRN